MTLKPGRNTLVRLSVLLVPLSWAAAKLGAPGAPATRVSMVSASAVVGPLAALSTVLPQLSLRRALSVYRPSARLLRVKVTLPAVMSPACSVCESSTVPAASISAKVSPTKAARPAPADKATVMRGEVMLVWLSVLEAPLSSAVSKSGKPGAAKAVVKMAMLRVTAVLLPAASVAVRLRVLPAPSPKAA